jgi:hypothetical protein
LAALLAVCPEIHNVLEYGPGKYSTGYLLERGVELISIECQSEEWYQKCLHDYGGRQGWMIAKSIGDYGEIQCVAETCERHCDLLFVDGNAHMRWICAQVATASMMADHIIIHDTEGAEYRLHRLWLPPEWVAIEVRDWFPWTTLLTTKESLVVPAFQLAFKQIKIMHGREMAGKEYIHRE